MGRPIWQMTESALRWTFPGVSPSGEGGSGGGVYIIPENGGLADFFLGHMGARKSGSCHPIWLKPVRICMFFQA